MERKRMSTAEKQAGFNIIELMVVLFVAGILLSFGVPAFNGFVANNRMAVAANDIASTLHAARTEAIKRRANVSICPSDTWDENDPRCSNTDLGDGWIVFVDSVPPAAPDLDHTGPDDVLLAHGPLEGEINLTVGDDGGVLGNDPFLVFAANGFPLDSLGADDAAFNFQLCDHRGDADTGGGRAAGRWIQLSPTGRPQIYRQQDQVQSATNPVGGC